MLHKGFKGREKRGEERVGSRRRSSCTSSRGFRPNFDVFFDAHVNESEIFRKKSFSIFWILTFFAIYLHRGWDERMVLKVQIFLMFHF